MRSTLIGLATLAFVATTGPVAAGPELVVDLTSGKVLIANGATDLWHPASLTKLMTTYVALKAIQEGRVRRESPVTVSALAAKAPPSRSGLRVGNRITLQDALRVLMVKSANDLAIAIAESVAGDVPSFVSRMNSESARLGMAASHWRNPHGLHDAGQVTTARDMAVLTAALRRDFASDADLFHIHAVTLAGRTMVNHNHSVGRYPYADGMKTGFICASGFNVVTTANKDGRELVAVVLGEDAPMRRDAKASLLLAAGFQIPTERSNSSLAYLSGPAKPPPSRSCGRRGATEDNGDGGLSTASMESWVRSFAAIPRDLSDPIPIRLLGSVAVDSKVAQPKVERSKPRREIAVAKPTSAPSPTVSPVAAPPRRF